MELLQAVKIVEGDIESSLQEQKDAWQWLIDEGHVRRLQGWYGRAAMELIDAGTCNAPSGKASNPGPDATSSSNSKPVTLS